MVELNTVQQLDQAIASRLFPSVTRWNRLEGRPRTHHFDRALRAEVRDGLWMLARQWQMREFVGDDAGSPVLARGMVDVHLIDRYQPDGHPAGELSGADPLEPRVERRDLPLRSDSQYLSLELRLVVGRRCLQLLANDPSVAMLSTAYLSRWPVPVPDPQDKADAAICAHADVWQRVGCAAGRAMDGIAFVEHVRAGGAAHDGVGASASQQATLTTLAGRLTRWFASLVHVPEDSGDAWDPTRLEYTFGISGQTGATQPDGSVNEVVMRAPGYQHGRLDWYALDARPDEPQLDAPQPPAKTPGPDVQSFIPTSILFDGMPSTRWWAFEDRRTNFGDVRPDKVDLGTLLMLDFALNFANDWFVVPWTLPVGCIAETRGIAITNVFGERTWIAPFVDDNARPERATWSMFQPSVPPGFTVPPRLVLLPVAPKVQEGPVVEQVALVRDEVANMVWAIERTVLLPSGQSRPGGEVAHEYRAHLRRLFDSSGVATPPPAPVAPLRYRLMTDVPEHWIPMIPVRVPGSTREIQLQRAALPRTFPGDPAPEKIRPRTPLLRQNFPAAYFIYEEVVPRSGIVVDQCYQRTRGPDGSVHLWYGARKGTGRGEAYSGLKFDTLVPQEDTPLAGG